MKADKKCRETKVETNTLSKSGSHASKDKKGYAKTDSLAKGSSDLLEPLHCKTASKVTGNASSKAAMVFPLPSLGNKENSEHTNTDLS